MMEDVTMADIAKDSGRRPSGRRSVRSHGNGPDGIQERAWPRSWIGSVPGKTPAAAKNA